MQSEKQHYHDLFFSIVLAFLSEILQKHAALLDIITTDFLRNINTMAKRP